MKKSYMRKSVLMTISAVCMLMLCNAFCLASSSEIKKTITSEISFEFIEPTVEHVAISSVVANGILNAKVLADFGDCKSANAYLEYKFGSSGSVSTITKEGINHNEEFYIGTQKGAITPSNTEIDYRIKCVFQSSEGEFVKYAPEGASSTTFVTASIVSEINEEVNGTEGGEIKVFCGDQSKTGDSGYIKVSVPKGAYSGSRNVKINFIDSSDSGLSAPKLVSSNIKENVISTVSVEVDGISEIEKPIQIDNLPLQKETTANKFVMQYKSSSDWEDTTDTNLNVDTVNEVFSFSAGKLGYYRVLENIILTDSSYRPINRIIIKSRIPDRYPGFEFNNLKEGDTVSIYNPKGKRIAKLTSGDSNGFVWKGKKGTDNNGDWAKSGIYIYQIKVKETGKLISGTIVFVY